ncbi:UDP-4-amino-4,6-dideoxy-N-acetyl-beta-L-altrosamine N-acetyltransferase [Pseudomonas sp. St290]|uniref:UDP-4-amino-4, 6-dideoxy-N-acetyl-beta-L-altrosamine N-acetyltransferase n=1 Tax=Pseudomonas sp. St290 TaxID=1602166 RepID=UPI001BED5BF9|nr:UDP-4-amino-4,6-dideoxy-N-acetyl-beta-L-altrosamine N-acetyltransferase [Pseudomonas sp. St290]BBH32119.1 pseudaminic acid biosynthesis N-acetyl transferase [Pseudomonas sp. St290]
MSDSPRTGASIRKMTTSDLGCVLAWRNHPEIRRYMYTQHEIGFAEHSAWFEKASLDTRKHLLIFEMNGLPQGYINITTLNSGGIADWGFYIAPEAIKGTGRQLGQMALTYAFETIGLHKVCGQALAFNERSIKFHRGLGFQQEGILRDQYHDGKNYHAVICFGLISHEWPRPCEKDKHVKS